MRRTINLVYETLKSNNARLLTSGGLILAGVAAIASNNNKPNTSKKLEEIKEGETHHHHKHVEAEPGTPYVPPDAPRYAYDATTTATNQQGKRKEVKEEEMLVVNAVLTYAPNLPPPITRKQPALVKVEMTSNSVVKRLNHDYKYPFWRFGTGVPGPFIRVRVGDTMEVTFTNKDESGMPHNIDFHSVLGPGGGSAVTNAEKDQTRCCRFKLFYPGLFIYHCSAAPVPLHIANGMYGLILVEPEEGMSKADKEFYVVQSEFYADDPEDPNSEEAEPSYSKGLKEQADIVVFNGKEGSLTEGNVLQAKVGERVRIYFGNAGPNLTSSFHVIGSIFDKVYREGSLMNPPDRGIQTTLVGPGSASIFELIPRVPGTYTLVDHAIFRLDKGAVGFLSVTGPKTPGIYESDDPPQPCVGCKLHA